MTSYVRTGIPSAGIFVGPAAWILNTEINYALVPWICAHKIQLVPVVAVVMVLLSLGGGFLSWRAYGRSSIAPQPDSSGAGRPHRFTALVGVAIALLFALVIVVQGAAGLVFHGCER